MVTSHLQPSTLLVFAMPLTQSLDPSLLPRVFAPTLLDLLDLWSSEGPGAEKVVVRP